MIHSPGCIAARDTAEVDGSAWSARWPNACPRCRGTGFDPYEDDPCGLCLEEGRCPRCGGSAVDPDWGMVLDGATPCPACGWVNGSGEDAIPPPAFGGDLCPCEEAACDRADAIALEFREEDR